MPGIPVTSGRDMADALANLILAVFVMAEQDRTMTDEISQMTTELKHFMMQNAMNIEDAQARIEHANVYIRSSLQLANTVVQDCNAVLDNLSHSSHRNIHDDNLVAHNHCTLECQNVQRESQVIALNSHHTEKSYQYNSRTLGAPDVGPASPTQLPGSSLTQPDVSPQASITASQVAHADHAHESTAGELKRQLSAVTGINHGNNKKLKGESDPENQKIYTLRQKENMTFDEIAEIITSDRISAGKEGTITSSAVYNRYKRNGPLIAMYRGEVFKPCQLDEEHGTMREFQRAEQAAPTGFDKEEDKLLVKAVTEIKQDYWKLVSERVEALGGRQHTHKDCAERFARIGLA